MKNAIRILNGLLIVNFFFGMWAGMKTVNLVLVIINAAAVITVVVMDWRKRN